MNIEAGWSAGLVIDCSVMVKCGDGFHHCVDEQKEEREGDGKKSREKGRWSLVTSFCLSSKNVIPM